MRIGIPAAPGYSLTIVLNILQHTSTCGSELAFETSPDAIQHLCFIKSEGLYNLPKVTKPVVAKPEFEIKFPVFLLL